MNEYDFNGNGKIDPEEREILMEDRRRLMLDSDAKRDTQRRLVVGFAIGQLAYPLVILLASWAGLDKAAQLITDIASVFILAASGVVAAYFGFNAMESKNATSSDRPTN
jgi:hypothetical protein|tara:strand:+ start:128 stop:454 length:327 start_codon:yes stop_codon:yes gene_type:complete